MLGNPLYTFPTNDVVKTEKLEDESDCAKATTVNSNSEENLEFPPEPTMEEVGNHEDFGFAIV